MEFFWGEGWCTEYTEKIGTVEMRLVNLTPDELDPWSTRLLPPIVNGGNSAVFDEIKKFVSSTE